MECPDFDTKQLHVLQSAYEFDDRFSHLLPAIALVESNAGRQLRNTPGKSYGVFHNYVPTVLARTTYTNSSTVINRLVTDFDFSAELAVEELEYWSDVRNSEAEVIKSYNAGWSMQYGSTYLKLINNAKHTLDKCVNFD